MRLRKTKWASGSITTSGLQLRDKHIAIICEQTGGDYSQSLSEVLGALGAEVVTHSCSQWAPKSVNKAFDWLQQGVNDKPFDAVIIIDPITSRLDMMKPEGNENGNPLLHQIFHSPLHMPILTIGSRTENHALTRSFAAKGQEYQSASWEHIRSNLTPRNPFVLQLVRMINFPQAIPGMRME